MISPAEIIAKLTSQETTPEIELNRLRARKTLLADQRSLLADQESVVDDRIADIERELLATDDRVGEPGDDPEDNGGDEDAA